MTVKEYLMQGYRLNNRIKIYQEEIERLRDLACSAHGISYDKEHTNPNKNTKSPFEGLLMETYEMEDELSEMLKALIMFKRELLEFVELIENKDERLVIHYRYVDNLSFQEIGDILCADRHTVRRWHDRAMSRMQLPANPTVIDRKLLKRGKGKR